MDNAISHMNCRADFVAAFLAAYTHLNPGGVLATTPDVTIETFQQNKTTATPATQDGLDVVFVENVYDPDPADDQYETTILYLIEGGPGGDSKGQGPGQQILLFARQKEHTIANIRLEPVAKESLKMLRASIPTMVEIREDIEEDLPSLLVDPSQIQQSIMNLCTNAGQVMEAEGGALTVTLDSVLLEAPLHTMVEELLPGRIPTRLGR